MEVVASLSLKVAQLLRSAACLHTNQSRSYLNHLVVLSLYFPPVNIHNAADGRNCKVGATLMSFVSLTSDGLRKNTRLRNVIICGM